ncbi:hypothetical protein CSKR_103414 [Clonorchis sinensis]|uniref:Uncharacterized protein n=1 Tax=Clonorchis sinensis TaxID=79923 RepID=A0A419PGL2_CLOSI|nr:hypothetical protein CSKR_103414 [Clonorchis sinensis]
MGREGAVKSRKAIAAVVLSNCVLQCRASNGLIYYGWPRKSAEVERSRCKIAETFLFRLGIHVNADYGPSGTFPSGKDLALCSFLMGAFCQWAPPEYHCQRILSWLDDFIARRPSIQAFQFLIPLGLFDALSRAMC